MSKISQRTIPGLFDKDGRFALSFVKQVMTIPGVRVDREQFMRSQLHSHCPSEQVEAAIRTSPKTAGIRCGKIDRIANGVIRYHAGIAGVGSFLAGIPGGLALLAALPADTVQFYCHAIVVAQKLAYLYGWPDLLKNGKVDDETEVIILMFLGKMLGVGQASNVLKLIAEGLAHEAKTTIPRKALTKTAYYPVIKKALKLIGVKLTKQSFAKSVSKVIPLLGGVISAVLTIYSLPPMARNLKEHLRGLELGKPVGERPLPAGD